MKNWKLKAKHKPCPKGCYKLAKGAADKGAKAPEIGFVFCPFAESELQVNVTNDCYNANSFIWLPLP
jgi:hypothetical protein